MSEFTNAVRNMLTALSNEYLIARADEGNGLSRKPASGYFHDAEGRDIGEEDQGAVACVYVSSVRR